MVAAAAVVVVVVYDIRGSNDNDYEDSSYGISWHEEVSIFQQVSRQQSS